MPDWLGDAGGVIGLVLAISAAAVVVANRSIKNDRITHLAARVKELGDELKDERGECDRKIAEQSHRISRQQGQIDALTGELGERIGQAIAKEVIARLVEEGQR